MASDCNSSSGSVVAKLKQERIRDNQRQSRARRQEYLADLERRLKKCHVTCREAELQRTAFADLQVENARLRNLLKYAGISPDILEGYGHRNMSTHAGQAAAAVHRQMKPKYQPQIPEEHSNIILETDQVSKPGSRRTTISRAATLSAPTAIMPMNSPSIYGSQHSVSLSATPVTDATSISSMIEVSSDPSYDWVVRSQHRPLMDASFCCDTFSLGPNGSLSADDRNSVSCLTAGAVINSYTSAPRAMEEVKPRLATGFSPQGSSNQDCRMIPQYFYSTWQDMNSDVY